MRDGYTEELLDIERRRRQHKFGRRARIAQLKLAAGVLLTAACGCWLHLWWYPRPSEHVWIDEVLVEVVVEGWLQTAAHALFIGAVLCSVFLAALSLCAGTEQRPRTFEVDRVLGRGRRSAQPADVRPSVPSLSLPRRPHAAGTMPDLARAPGDGGIPRRTAGALFDAARPMRSGEALDRYLDTLAQQRVRPGRAELAAGRPASFYTPPTSASWPAASAAAASGSELTQGTVRVLYEVGGSEAVHAAQSGLDWASLSVAHPEMCLGRMREWVREVCLNLVKEVDACDEWFHNNDVWAFDCANPLSEIVPGAGPAPQAAAPMGLGGFGAPAAPAAPMRPVTKQVVLLREKEQVRSYQRSGEHFNTGLRYDQRLGLEARLDVALTFVPDEPLTAVAQRQTRAYVLARLRTLANQQTLVSFKNNAGDAELWRPGLPCDAHLLLHVLRTSVTGLYAYVRFGHQGALSVREDLALFAGDTGAPYFYVRHFRDGRDRLYVTHPGQSTLFEALLVFAAVIHLYHADHYGGVRGTVDLAETGLLRVLTGRSAPQMSRPAFRPSRSTF